MAQLRSIQEKEKGQLLDAWRRERAQMQEDRALMEARFKETEEAEQEQWEQKLVALEQRLRGEMAEKEGAASQMQAALQKEGDKLRRQLEERNLRIDTLQKTSAQLETMVSEQSENLRRLEQEGSIQRMEIQKLRSYEDYKNEAGRLGSDVLRRDSQIAELEGRLQEAQSAREQAERKLGNANSVIEQLRRELEEIQSKLDRGEVEIAENQAKRILSEARLRRHNLLKEAEDVRSRILAAAKATYYSTLQFKVTMAEQFTDLEREIDNSVGIIRQIELPSVPRDALGAGEDDEQQW